MYATKDQLEQRVKRGRVTADCEIPGFGLASLQTITAREFARIDAARNRALVAASGGNMKDQVAALNDQFVELAKACFVEPAFTDADRELLLSLDSSVAAAMKDACYAHCELADVPLEASVQDAKKN